MRSLIVGAVLLLWVGTATADLAIGVIDLGADDPSAACVGDCDGDGVVRINELITGIHVLLGDATVSACPAIDCPQPLGGVFVNCGIVAVSDALQGCE